MAGDEDGGVDSEPAAVELAETEDVGEGFLGLAALDQGFGGEFVEFDFGVGEDVGAVDEKDVGGEELSFEAR